MTKFQLNLSGTPRISSRNTNLSRSCGPSQGRVKLKPLFKKGARTHTKNARPTSLLAVVTNIIEESIDFHLEDHLNDLNVILTII